MIGTGHDGSTSGTLVALLGGVTAAVIAALLVGSRRRELSDLHADNLATRADAAAQRQLLMDMQLDLRDTAVQVDQLGSRVGAIVTRVVEDAKAKQKFAEGFVQAIRQHEDQAPKGLRIVRPAADQ